MRRALLACLLLAGCGSETKKVPEGNVVWEIGSDRSDAASPSAEPLTYANLPNFDARRVCDPIAINFSDDVKPHNVDPVCYAEEVSAKKALSKLRVPVSIATHCEQLATVSRGAYAKFKACVDENLANEATLSRIEADNGS